MTSGFIAWMIPRDNKCPVEIALLAADIFNAQRRIEAPWTISPQSDWHRDSHPPPKHGMDAFCQNGPSQVKFSPTKSCRRHEILLSFPLAEASKGTTRFEKTAKMKYVLVSGG